MSELNPMTSSQVSKDIFPTTQLMNQINPRTWLGVKVNVEAFLQGQLCSSGLGELLTATFTLKLLIIDHDLEKKQHSLSDKVKEFLHPVKQPGFYWDRPTALPLVVTVSD